MIQLELAQSSEGTVKRFESLVNEIREKMLVVNPMMRATANKVYSNDITAWMDFVKFDSKAIIKKEIWINGRKTIIEPGVTKLYENLNEAKSAESKLLGVAMAKAKLDLILETADSVYPALLSNAEVNQYLSYLDKVRDEVLGIEKEEVSNKGVNRRTPMALRRIVLITSLLLAGCAGVVKAANVSSGKSEISSAALVDYKYPLRSILDTSPVIEPTVTSTWDSGGTEFRQLYSDVIEDKLIEANWVPLKDSHGNLNYEFFNGKQWVCSFNRPTVINNPFKPGEEATFLMKKDQPGVLLYGDWDTRQPTLKVLSAVPLPAGLGEDITCVSVIKKDSIDSVTGYGEEHVLLINKVTGKIIGEVPFLFDANSTIEAVITDGEVKILVDGVELEFDR